MEKRKSTDWNEVKSERLAIEYVAVREQLWAPLAARMNEPWALIEAKVSVPGIEFSCPVQADDHKCMEHGHRTLEQKARDAGQRDQIYYGPGQIHPSMREDAPRGQTSSSLGSRRRHTLAAVDEEPSDHLPRHTRSHHQASMAYFEPSAYSMPLSRSMESRVLPLPYQPATPFHALPSPAYPSTRSANPPASVASFLNPITTTAP